VIALGGGVVGDVAGFAAATFMRGVRWVQVPTTIVAQVDSSVGGKTGVNHPQGKNTIGAFHQPAAVVIDLTLLRTLPDREVRAGLAEVIKHGVIADAGLFAYLEREASAILAKDLAALEWPVERSCEIKAAVVAEDEYEQGRRADLNYGHTFGHAIESATAYRRFLHGEAVALGMHAAALLAADLGLVDRAFVQRQRACLAAYGLPVSWSELPVDDTLQVMHHDKKARAGALRFIVPDRLGHVVHRTDVPETQVRNVLEALRNPYKE
jgi:3-dehydroquinate synthase